MSNFWYFHVRSYLTCAFPELPRLQARSNAKMFWGAGWERKQSSVAPLCRKAMGGPTFFLRRASPTFVSFFENRFSKWSMLRRACETSLFLEIDYFVGSTILMIHFHENAFLKLIDFNIRKRQPWGLDIGARDPNVGLVSRIREDAFSWWNQCIIRSRFLWQPCRVVSWQALSSQLLATAIKVATAANLLFLTRPFSGIFSYLSTVRMFSLFIVW